MRLIIPRAGHIYDLRHTVIVNFLRLFERILWLYDVRKLESKFELVLREVPEVAATGGQRDDPLQVPSPDTPAVY